MCNTGSAHFQCQYNCSSTGTVRRYILYLSYDIFHILKFSVRYGTAIFPLRVFNSRIISLQARFFEIIQHGAFEFFKKKERT